MAKKIILSTIVFIGMFAVSAAIFMPYTHIATKIIDDITNERRIDIRYNTIKVGLFGAEITKLATGNLVIDKVTLKYNLIGLLLKKLSFNADSSAFTASGSLSGNKLTADIKGSVAGLAKMAGFNGSGSVDAKIIYDISSSEGNAILKGGAVTFIHPLMKIEADSLEAEASIKDRTINISKALAKGKTTLDATGTVTLNNKKIEHSVMDISGKAGIMGMDTKFRLNGTFLSPRFTTN